MTLVGHGGIMLQEKEDQLLCKRLKELARIADLKYADIFTDFLNLNDLNLFYQLKNDLPNIQYSLFGGYENAERRMLCFHGQEIQGNYECKDRNECLLPMEVAKEHYPIQCIHIQPMNKKFSDAFSHRDFLGAVLNLGIERDKIGDILIKENEGFLFCHKNMSQYILDHLNKIKHTNVTCEVLRKADFNIEPSYIDITGTVTSVRLDSILAVAFQTSRSSISGYISGGKVFVGGKQVLSNSYVLKENEIVSIRGLGKFCYLGTSYQTKKGRLLVHIKKYN